MKLSRSWTLLLLGFTLAASVVKADGVPQLVNYQGKVYQPSGASVPDGAYKVAFSIYDVPTAGTAIWTETYDALQVKGSSCHVLLGSTNPIGATIFNTADRYLGVKLGNDPELAPRQKIASVPYAMVAEKATSATTANEAVHAVNADVAQTVPDGAVTTAKIGPSAVTSEQLADGAITASKLSSGSITLGYAQITAPFVTTSIGSYVDVPGLSVTVVVPPGGRRIKVTGYCNKYWNQNNENTGVFVAIREGLTVLNFAYQENAGWSIVPRVMWVGTPSAGSHTYTISVNKTTGQFYGCYDAEPTGPAFILVEAI